MYKYKIEIVCFLRIIAIFFYNFTGTIILGLLDIYNNYWNKLACATLVQPSSLILLLFNQHLLQHTYNVVINMFINTICSYVH